MKRINYPVWLTPAARDELRTVAMGLGLSVQETMRRALAAFVVVNQEAYAKGKAIAKATEEILGEQK